MNDGSELEGLVAAIEESLAPAGVTVEVNVRDFEDGVQIAEFDVIIEGGVGTTSTKWLIQCRDRPSKGSAPGEWILELVGRKQQYKFDKVFAVSTTGFSPGAKRFAKDQGIVLRSVSSVDAIADDFGTIEFRLQAHEVRIKGYLDIHLVNRSPEQLDLVNQLLQEHAKVRGIKAPDQTAFWDAR